MGKGDAKTKRGKIFKGSYGNCRQRGKNQEASSTSAKKSK